jgi:hypothetical protein
MNLHRQMSDNLLEIYLHNNESKYTLVPIRRGRYNRCVRLKAKLALIREEFFKNDPTPVRINRPLRFRFDSKPDQSSTLTSSLRKSTTKSLSHETAASESSNKVKVN